MNKMDLFIAADKVFQELAEAESKFEYGKFRDEDIAYFEGKADGVIEVLMESGKLADYCVRVARRNQ